MTFSSCSFITQAGWLICDTEGKWPLLTTGGITQRWHTAPPPLCSAVAAESEGSYYHLGSKKPTQGGGDDGGDNKHKRGHHFRHQDILGNSHPVYSTMRGTALYSQRPRKRLSPIRSKLDGFLLTYLAMCRGYLVSLCPAAAMGGTPELREAKRPLNSGSSPKQKAFFYGLSIAMEWDGPPWACRRDLAQTQTNVGGSYEGGRISLASSPHNSWIPISLPTT